VDIVLLEPDDAEYVEDLANHHYPVTYPMSLDDIADNLRKADKDSFCFGVEDKGKILGYLMAWVDNTMVEGRREKVLLVDDIVLGNRARHQLFRLLNTMIKEMQTRGFGKLPIEGSARPSSSNTFMGHPEALERLGYELASKAEYYEDEFEEYLTWVRYEPIEESAATINVNDTLEIIFEEDDDGEFEDFE
jgi:Acetyltransferase (GNAT) family